MHVEELHPAVNVEDAIEREVSKEHADHHTSTGERRLCLNPRRVVGVYVEEQAASQTQEAAAGRLGPSRASPAPLHGIWAICARVARVGIASRGPGPLLAASSHGPRKLRTLGQALACAAPAPVEAAAVSAQKCPQVKEPHRPCLLLSLQPLILLLHQALTSPLFAGNTCAPEKKQRALMAAPRMLLLQIMPVLSATLAVVAPVQEPTVHVRCGAPLVLLLLHRPLSYHPVSHSFFRRVGPVKLCSLLFCRPSLALPCGSSCLKVHVFK